MLFSETDIQQIQALHQTHSKAVVGKMQKIGELPRFGEPLPELLLGLLDAQGDLLDKAKQSEDLGFGIGAFTYYRRIVEAQRAHLFGEIKRVAQAEGADDIVVAVDAALRETQFQKSVDAMKGLLPRSLLVDGNNPLALLHDACSDGVHNLGDEECLERAQVIHTVLQHLAEKLDVALRERQEIRQAIGKLTKWKGAREADKAS